MDKAISRRDFIGGAVAVGAGITLFGLAGCSAGNGGGSASAIQDGGYASGTYSAQATGLDTVTVEMTFSETEITKVDIDVPNETAGIGGDAAAKLKDEILAKQGLDVDAVSGATMTCTAVAIAAANCMAQARGEAESITVDYISPIPPVSVPDSWDYETEVVFVGSNGGGVLAAARLAQNGVNTITVEKNSYVGGTGRVTGMFMGFGGTKLDPENYGFFATPYKDQDVIDFWQERSQWTVNPELLEKITICIRETMDWYVDNGASIVRLYPEPDQWWYGWKNPETGDSYATDELIDHIYGIAVDNGAEYLFNTKVTALVMDGDECVGVQAFAQNGQTIYVKSSKAVVLSADNFQANSHMLKEYCGFGGNVKVGLALGNGEVIRMGQGCGADMAGLGCYGGTSDSLPVPPSNADMLPRYQYFESSNYVARAPWLHIDKFGNRCDFLNWAETKRLAGQAGDCLEVWSRRGAQQLSRGESYKFFDSNYVQLSESFASADTGQFPGMVTGKRLAENPGGMYPTDIGWGGVKTFEESWDDALARGIYKQADSLEELAELMELDPQVLAEAVSNWNAICERGVDDPLYHYDPAFLNPIKDPPFYGVEVTCGLYSSWCGLKVSDRNEVIDTEGNVIPGLYANFHVAGGLAGQGSALRGIGDQIGAMFASGYNISKALLEEEYERI